MTTRPIDPEWYVRQFEVGYSNFAANERKHLLALFKQAIEDGSRLREMHVKDDKPTLFNVTINDASAIHTSPVSVGDEVTREQPCVEASLSADVVGLDWALDYIAKAEVINRGGRYVAIPISQCTYIVSMLKRAKLYRSDVVVELDDLDDALEFYVDIKEGHAEYEDINPLFFVIVEAAKLYRAQQSTRATEGEGK